MRDTGIEIVDLATGTVATPGRLTRATTRSTSVSRAGSDRQAAVRDKTTVRRKLIDRFEIGKPQFSVIDLARRK